ncbi:MAG: transposase, partial [Gemmataceae bacterium]
LPPYSPELNPVEYLNNDMKGAVNEPGMPDDREALLARVTAFMNTLAAFPKHVMNYFLHPRVHYAAEL